MKVKCNVESLDDIKGDLLNFFNTGNSSLFRIGLTANAQYTVLAISAFKRQLFVYIMDDDDLSYPVPFPVDLFQITDSRISSIWYSDLTEITSFDELNLENEEVISFKEWTIRRSRFYENLLDEDKGTIELFNNYLKTIKEEDD